LTACAIKENAVWVAPGATEYSCLCERCLDGHHGRGAPFLDAVRLANVRGTLDLDAVVAFVRCHNGHELTVRRIDRPPALARHDARQLQIA
jgi:hypothetical protein